MRFGEKIIWNLEIGPLKNIPLEWIACSMFTWDNISKFNESHSQMKSKTTQIHLAVNLRDSTENGIELIKLHATIWQ